MGGDWGRWGGAPLRALERALPTHCWQGRGPGRGVMNGKDSERLAKTDYSSARAASAAPSWRPLLARFRAPITAQLASKRLNRIGGASAGHGGGCGLR